jgi:hypothetical protein
VSSLIFTFFFLSLPVKFGAKPTNKQTNSALGEEELRKKVAATLFFIKTNSSGNWTKNEKLKKKERRKRLIGRLALLLFYPSLIFERNQSRWSDRDGFL